jgi:myo-inositol 2-dehydrogenase/D-chiro-inositol 1-dehydrogenase
VLDRGLVDPGEARPGTGLLPDTSGGESPYLTEIREVYAAFRGGPAPRVSAVDGLQAVRLAEAAILSIDSGEAVTIDALLPGAAGTGGGAA